MLLKVLFTVNRFISIVGKIEIFMLEVQIEGFIKVRLADFALSMPIDDQTHILLEVRVISLKFRIFNINLI